MITKPRAAAAPKKTAAEKPQIVAASADLFDRLRRQRLLHAFTALSEPDQLQVIAVAEACAVLGTIKRAYTGRGSRTPQSAATRALVETELAAAGRWMRDMGKVARGGAR